MLDIIGICGFLGALFLGVCAVPELIKTIKNKKTDMSSGFLTLWTLGSFFMLIYSISRIDIPLILNLTLNLSIATVLWIYKK